MSPRRGRGQRSFPAPRRARSRKCGEIQRSVSTGSPRRESCARRRAGHERAVVPARTAMSAPRLVSHPSHAQTRATNPSSATTCRTTTDAKPCCAKPNRHRNTEAIRKLARPSELSPDRRRIRTPSRRAMAARVPLAPDPATASPAVRMVVSAERCTERVLEVRAREIVRPSRHDAENDTEPRLRRPPLRQADLVDAPSMRNSSSPRRLATQVRRARLVAMIGRER